MPKTKEVITYMDEFLILLQAKLDEAKSQGNINDGIKVLQNKLDKLKIQAELDPKAAQKLADSIGKLINQKIVISNIGIDTKSGIKAGQEYGKQVSQGISQGMSSISKSTEKVLRDFSELNDAKRKFVDGHDLISKDDIADAERLYDTVRKAFSEFGQVTVSKGSMNDGSLENMRVKIEQVNGEMKITRDFMLYFNESKNGFKLVDDDTIRTTEKMIQHLNEEKNIINATNEEANAIKAKLAEQEKYYKNIKNEVNNLYNLKTKLLSADELQTAELEKQIKQTKERISYNNKQIDKKDLRDNSLDRQINDLEVAKQKQLNLASAKSQDTVNTKELAQAEREATAALKERQAIEAQVNKIQLLSNGGIKNDYPTQIAKIEGNFRTLGLTQDQITEKMKNVTSSFDVLKTRINQPFNESNYQEIIDLNNKLQTELAESGNEYTRLQSAAKGYVTMQQRLSKANEIEAWNQKNTAVTKEVKAANDAYIVSLRDLNSQMSKMQFNEIVNGFKKSENSMRLLGKLGLSLRNQMTQAMSSFSTWLSASTLVMTFISKTRNAVTELKDVNTLLTEISKTNHSLTQTDLDGIGNRGFDIASKYGKGVTDYLTGVQDMSRAGYQNAEAMAEISTAAQGAGDMTAEIANKMVIATDKAYKLGGSVEELTKILDGVNWICDNNAVNMSELSEGMSIVGSTAASLGVDVDELTATLGTMAASTQQSGSEVARAFKAILLNIRQVSDEEEGIDAEGLTKYEKACNALGVSLKETKNGVLQTRDAMEVLKELSEEYNKLDENDIRRTDLLNSVGGKLRSTQLDALLRQWDMYENMLNQFSEGSGTMAAEAEKTANSWEGSLKRLHNTWVDTVGNIVNSDFVITITNGFNGLLSVINNVTSKLGSLGTIGLGAGLFAGLKNVGKPKMFGFNYCLNMPTVC